MQYGLVPVLDNTEVMLELSLWRTGDVRAPTYHFATLVEQPEPLHDQVLNSALPIQAVCG
jgi:hypothetical protein